MRESFEAVNAFWSSRRENGKEDPMRLAAMLVLFTVLPAGVAAATPDTHRVPREVRRMVERFEACVHFAGEFSGDGSERDREVNATMKNLRCDKVEKDAAALRRKYVRHPDALKALDAFNGF
jgi:hypothetical protein